jgi:hypothetical protein
MSRTKAVRTKSNAGPTDQGPEHAPFLNHVLDHAAEVLAANPTDARRVRYVRALPHIMTMWYALPRYLGSDDGPIPLKLKGRGPTFRELVASVLPGEDPLGVAEALIRAGAVKRSGDRYVAISRQVIFPDDPEFAHAHTIGILNSHIDTIQYNVARKEPKERALEREVFNLTIPVRLLSDIHREIKKDGQAFLSRLDDLLLENQVEPGTEPTVGVGVSVCAYQDQWRTTAEELAPREGLPGPQETGNRTQEDGVDKVVGMAIGRFVRICRMFGVSQNQFIASAREEYFKHAGSPPRLRKDESKEIPEATEVMTIWHDDPRYTQNGKPRSLYKRGASPSFETLVREVDASLDVDKVLKYLIRTGTVERRGTRYIALSDTVIVHGVEGPAVEWAVRSMELLLGVTENNLNVTNRRRDGLFERRVEHPRVPVSQLPRLKKFIEEEGMALLRRGRTFLREIELEGIPGEPTVEAGFGVYRHQNATHDGSADRSVGSLSSKEPSAGTPARKTRLPRRGR